MGIKARSPYNNRPIANRYLDWLLWMFMSVGFLTFCKVLLVNSQKYLKYLLLIKILWIKLHLQYNTTNQSNIDKYKLLSKAEAVGYLSANWSRSSSSRSSVVGSGAWRSSKSFRTSNPRRHRSSAADAAVADGEAGGADGGRDRGRFRKSAVPPGGAGDGGSGSKRSWSWSLCCKRSWAEAAAGAGGPRPA